MRSAHRLSRAVAWLGLVVALVGCAREDGSKIIGQWRAERFQVMSLQVPIGPELTISRDALMAGPELTLPLGGITQDGSEITLDLPMMLGLTFTMVDDNRMYVDLPLVERIYYRRVAAAAQPAMVPTAPVLAPASAARAGNTPVATASAYKMAQDAARRGDLDGAVRLLHRAFAQEEVDATAVRADPAWLALRDDVRFQALLARYGE